MLVCWYGGHGECGVRIRSVWWGKGGLRGLGGVQNFWFSGQCLGFLSVALSVIGGGCRFKGWFMFFGCHLGFLISSPGPGSWFLYGWFCSSDGLCC